MQQLLLAAIIGCICAYRDLLKIQLIRQTLLFIGSQEIGLDQTV